MTKAQVVELLATFPDKFDVEDLFERMLFLQQLEDRLAESDKDQVVSFEEARQRLAQSKQRAA
ncbi:hypothetical protein [Hymenobacter bucti]|uniref:Uncharacterized protein n=1 Tax=Hymenobacter bucti TaxID=1844114 RepID=A0ABW4QVJ2_9BACT